MMILMMAIMLKPENDKLSPSSKHKHMWLANWQNNHAGRVVVTPRREWSVKSGTRSRCFLCFLTYVPFWHQTRHTFLTCVCLSVACRQAHTCQIMPCSSCGIWMHCKTFSPELTAAKSWQKSNCAKVRKVLRGTHTDLMRSPLYSIIRQGLKASLISPLLPLCTSQTHISWALRVTEESWLSNLIRNSV